MTDKEALKFLKELHMQIMLPRMNGKSILTAHIIEAHSRALQALEEKVRAQEAAAPADHIEFGEENMSIDDFIDNSEN